MSARLYQELGRESQAIRIITLLSGQESSPIHCTLQQIALGDNTSYHAVSYAWGDPEITRPIFVNNIEIQVRSNLEACLRHLRQSDKHLQLWIDAICINQNDDQEKSHQVHMMGKIFRSCTSAYIWLGIPKAANGSIHKARTSSQYDQHWYLHFTNNRSVNGSMETESDHVDPFLIVRHFAEDRHLYDLPCFRRHPDQEQFAFHRDLGFEADWNQFMEAIQKSWWTRFWCVQESLLPPAATVILGSWTVPWKTIKVCENNYKRHLATCCNTSSGLMPEDYIFYADITIVSTQVDPDGMTSLMPGISSDLDRLLRSFRYKACQDPRDKVYGILGLLDPSSRSRLTVDYSLDTSAVYVTAMKAMLADGHGSLRCLTGLGFNSQKSDLPSWVRDFQIQPDMGSMHHEMGRLKVYDLYDASKASNAILAFDSENVLTLRGRLVDKVHRVGQVATRRTSNEVWRVIRSWAALFSMNLPEDLAIGRPYDESKEVAFWRTLISDVFFDDGEKSRRTTQGDEEVLRKWLVATHESFKIGVMPGVDRIMKSIVVATFGRSMFLSAKGNLGLCYPDCQAGDEIWTLEGGKVLFVLRPTSSTPYENGITTVESLFCGDCYMHHFMDGEAAQESRYTLQEVRLR